MSELSELMSMEDEDNLDVTYLVFDMAGEQYAVFARDVTEIVRLQSIVALPDVPPHIKGVMSLRGRVIPIMDMRLRCGLDAAEYNDRTVVIVLEVEGRVTGLVVDSVLEVVEIEEDAVDFSSVADPEESVIRGLGRKGGEVVIIVDAAKLLFHTDDEVSIPVP